MQKNLGGIRRREMRIYVALPVNMREESARGMVLQGDTIDLSDGGMRVRAEAPFLIRQNVVVVLCHNPHLTRNYRVMWVHNRSNGRPIYEAGLKIQAA